ncbi:MAG: hypothetical protein RTV72_05335 [Candidatus Thorarchaeota archaeon]
MLSEPKITPSVIAAIPDVLKNHLLESIIKESEGNKRSMLISSNSLANKFIFTRWGIRPSQRKRNKNLFSKIRQQSRTLFQHLLSVGQITCTQGPDAFRFGVYLFDGVRGNLILGFIHLDDENPFV